MFLNLYFAPLRVAASARENSSVRTLGLLSALNSLSFSFVILLHFTVQRRYRVSVSMSKRTGAQNLVTRAEAFYHPRDSPWLWGALRPGSIWVEVAQDIVVLYRGECGDGGKIANWTKRPSLRGRRGLVVGTCYSR